MTNLGILSINTIDKITHVCYTQNKLEHKTNILTNNKNKKQRKTKMTETIKLPTKVINADWKDDVDYQPYANEAEYIQPQKVETATAEQAKRRNIKIGRVAFFSKNEQFAA